MYEFDHTGRTWKAVLLNHTKPTDESNTQRTEHADGPGSHRTLPLTAYLMQITGDDYESLFSFNLACCFLSRRNRWRD